MVKKRQREPASGGGAYAWFWAWMTMVTIVTVWVYVQAAGIMSSVALAVANLAETEGKIAAEGWWEVVSILVGVLFWWRVVKVVVLQGSPIAFGMELMPGRQDDGRAGRPVARAAIGNSDVYVGTYTGQFWYGAVFRAHPTSDKLMRSRVELLLLALPCGFTLCMHESRLFLNKTGHEGRAKQFRTFADNYARKTEGMPSGQFRKSLSDGVNKIAKAMQK